MASRSEEIASEACGLFWFAHFGALMDLAAQYGERYVLAGLNGMLTTTVRTGGSDAAHALTPVLTSLIESLAFALAVDCEEVTGCTHPAEALRFIADMMEATYSDEALDELRSRLEVTSLEALLALPSAGE